MSPKPFARAAAVFGALVLVLAWAAALQAHTVPVVAVCTVGGLAVGGLLLKAMRNRS